MRIGELSKLSGFTKETIRYYQGLGFFEGAVTQEKNNYRVFTQDAIQILQLIKESKHYGFTLKENLVLVGVRNQKEEKLNLIEKFLHNKVQNNIKAIDELVVQNERLRTLKIDIQRCRELCV